MVHLEFHESLVSPVLDGEKTATVRYELEHGISTGDRIVFTANREPFAVAEIDNRIASSVRAAPSVVKENGWRHGASDAEDLRSRLNHHYRDRIELHHYVEVLGFDVEAAVGQ
jgi:hypothetical protein